MSRLPNDTTQVCRLIREQLALVLSCGPIPRSPVSIDLGDSRTRGRRKCCLCWSVMPPPQLEASSQW